MINRRSFIAALSLSSLNMFLSPLTVMASNEEDDRMVNPPAEWIVQGPSRRYAKKVSYARLKSQVGGAINLGAIGSALLACLGISLPIPNVVRLLSALSSAVLSGTSSGDPNRGVVAHCIETTRYVRNPSTGHQTFYDVTRGVESFSLY